MYNSEKHTSSEQSKEKEGDNRGDCEKGALWRTDQQNVFQ